MSYLGFFRFPMGFHNIFGFILIIFVVQSKTKIIKYELFYEAKVPTSDGYSEI